MKDRLAELRRLSMQESNGKQVDREKAAGGPATPSQAEKASLLDPFFDLIERLQTEIDSLKSDIQKVQNVHSFLLNAKEPDKKIISERTSELDRLNDRIRKSSIAIKNKLRDLREQNEKLQDGDPGPGGMTGKTKLTATELRIRETQLSFLQKWFVDLMTEHSTSQSEYNERHKRLLRTQMEVIGISRSDEEFDRMMNDNFSDVFTDGLLQKTAEARQALAEVTARHEIILQLEKSIHEVHELFMQMATLVESQGEMIDVIERNVLKATEATKSGQIQMREAREKQSSARKKKIMCYAIIAVVVVIVIFLLIYT